MENEEKHYIMNQSLRNKLEMMNYNILSEIWKRGPNYECYVFYEEMEDKKILLDWSLILKSSENRKYEKMNLKNASKLILKLRMVNHSNDSIIIITNMLIKGIETNTLAKLIHISSERLVKMLKKSNDEPISEKKKMLISKKLDFNYEEFKTIIDDSWILDPKNFFVAI